MSTEDLMKPRYEVIADYPGSNFILGEILTVEYTGILHRKPMSNYPHLFKPLQWWEHRKPEEMPEYAWYNASGFSKKEKMIVIKIKKWVKEDDGELWAQIEGDEIGYATVHMPKPATEADYNHFINSKQ